MTRKVFNYGGGMHSPTALTAFLRDALDGDVADGMKVVAGSGMNVTVQAGTARVGKDPSYDINVTGTESVDVGAASPSNPMNALIVAYVDRAVAGNASVTDNINDVFKLKAVSGAAAPSPADPSTSAIQSAIGAANPYIILARVRKRAGATSVVASDITDMRVMVTLKTGRINSSSASILDDGVISSGHIGDGMVLPRHLNVPIQYGGGGLSTNISKTFTPSVSGLLFVEAHSRRNSSSPGDNIITIGASGATNLVTGPAVANGNVDGYASATLQGSVTAGVPVTITITATSAVNGRYLFSVTPGVVEFIA